MKKLLLAYILILVLGIAQAQDQYVATGDFHFENTAEKALWESGSANPYLLFKAVQAEKSPSDAKWNTLLGELDQKFEKKGVHINVLRQIFGKSHQHLFKTYGQHATFNDMLSTGMYDCVSGSAALGLLLTRYGFDYDIVETDYHVFVMVYLDGKNIILESTLPIGGMMTAPSEVLSYLESYKPKKDAKPESLNTRIGVQKIDVSDNAIFRKVTLKELAGLQYYNDAIALFNQQQFEKAAIQLDKALKLYPSGRIEGLKMIAQQQVPIR